MPKATVTESRMAFAAVGKNLTERLKAAPGSWAKVLMFGSFVAGFVPLIGIGASFLIDRARSSHIEKKKKEVLADYYREPIAARLGIKPEKVGVRDLELAAQVDPTLANAIDKVKKEKKYMNRAATFASAGVAAVAWVPGINGITNGLAKGAVHFGASMAGSTISTILEKDVLYTHDVIEIIDMKRSEGQPVTAMDIVLLRIAQSPEWQKEFKEKNGKSFHKLSESEQQSVIASAPDLIMGADRQAEALNRGLISPQNLMMAGPESTSNFAGNAAGSSQTKSFTSMIEQQRAAAAAAAQQRA